MLGKSALEELDGTVQRLGGVSCDELDSAELIDLISGLEDLKHAAAAAQAKASVAFDTKQRVEQAAAGVPARRRGEGVAAQLGLARRESPFKAARLLGLGKVLTHEMPHTLGLMTTGELSEWRATLLARETACLSLDHRKQIDAELCKADSRGAAPAARMSDTELVRAARRRAAELDNAAVAARFARAESERTVTIRPAPDGMTYVTGLLPVKQGVAVWATLSREADAARASGSPRSRGQVMADVFYERLTGQATADPVGVEVQLVMTDRALLAGDDEPAHLPGYGPVPAAWARETVARSANQVAAFLRRLYTTPEAGTLVAMDSRARLAPKGLARFIEIRDQGICRNPWCGAPIRNIDHAEPYAEGGPTSERNLQGLCERCNLAKEALGWTHRPVPGAGPHRIDITTPTGHRYRSRAPDPPGRAHLGHSLTIEPYPPGLTVDIDGYLPSQN